MLDTDVMAPSSAQDRHQCEALACNMVRLIGGKIKRQSSDLPRFAR
jgi:hypothetical protein